MTNPRLSSVKADWMAARATFDNFDQGPAHDDTAGGAAPDALARLNTATEKVFAKIAASPVPVLLPFDTAAFLRDAAQGTSGDPGKYLSGLQTTPFFFAGPAGYDAILSLQPETVAGLDLTFANRVDVLISGSAVLYDVAAPALAEAAPVPALSGDFPDLRRVLLEEHLRYTFTRYGVPYVVSMQCNDGPTSAHRLSCREADKIAMRVLKSLNIAGGTPPMAQTPAPAPIIERPKNLSPDFTYYAPGDIVPGSGVKGQAGRADATVYAKIRFPMAQAPAYANSQSFMNWGDCDHTGRTDLHGDGKTATYRCQINQIPLTHDKSKNYAYPWRDNFCEHRYYYVGQCPTGLGHQGQDIRPGSCLLRNDGADRCNPYADDVVAVRDGVLMRSPGDKALYLVVDGPGEHIRFRYLHMDPQLLDAAGMVSGRVVSEGERIGQVGNYARRAGGTTYHLHFDMQVLTRDGWAFASPYMTLVAAYERLIGGRGQVVRDPPVTAAATATPATGGEAIATDAAPNAIVAAENSESEATAGHQTVSAETCKTRVVKGHRRRLCGPDRAERRERARHAVRSVDRGVSRQGHGARHHGGNLHARHGGTASRHHRA